LVLVQLHIEHCVKFSERITVRVGNTYRRVIHDKKGIETTANKKNPRILSFRKTMPIVLNDKEVKLLGYRGIAQMINTCLESSRP
jgi:hypothetical protein